ncbi:inorganic pyrophosphatase [Acanthopleuribacter pedis]|uniref:inorganic diphosphatase n=1 Tax=Acanthopleuribacter pedis TaxID=442870 RepID=A0A8J7U5Q1_9BACT|nr:inorganic pyrophosphatase [Acanthopleuribacter pedis]MBO1321089.1 inorganic pyrophosphatase [Acanthopleuribacter pedis]
MMIPTDPIWDMMGQLFQQHPWHGVTIGPESPEMITCYVEMVSNDTIKYELDKVTGHLKVDRPQKYSNICPTLYGLVPQTYCAEKVADRCNEALGRNDIVGDHDPLDICVLTEKNINHGNFFLQAIPIGGLRMLDGNEADEKIVAVMKDDRLYGHMRDIDDLPKPLLDRLRHYFLTYKEAPDYLTDQSNNRIVEIPEIYSREEAFEVIKRSQEDYTEYFSHIKGMLTKMLRGPWFDMSSKDVVDKPSV